MLCRILFEMLADFFCGLYQSLVVRKEVLLSILYVANGVDSDQNAPGGVLHKWSKLNVKNCEENSQNVNIESAYIMGSR